MSKASAAGSIRDESSTTLYQFFGVGEEMSAGSTDDYTPVWAGVEILSCAVRETEAVGVFYWRVDGARGGYDTEAYSTCGDDLGGVTVAIEDYFCGCYGAAGVVAIHLPGEEVEGHSCHGDVGLEVEA